MTKHSGLQQYLTEAGELPRDVLLGHIVMYSVSDGEYDRDFTDREFTRLMLDHSYLPHPNRAIDAFRKATSKLDDFEYELPSGDTAHVLVRDVSNDKNQVVRHLIREVKDSRARRLAYAQIGEAVFYRPTTAGGIVQQGTERMRITLDASTFVPNERERAVQMAERIESLYARYVASMDDMKVRGMFRDYVSGLNAVQLRSGVYFVHVSRYDDLLKLKELAGNMAAQAQTTCRMDLMPLIDLQEQREMVIDAFQVEASKSLEGIATRIATLRQSRKKITPQAYATVKEEYDAVIKRAVEYTRELNITQDRTSGAAEVALQSLIALQQQMIKDAT